MWTSAPPSSSAVTSSPVARLHERRSAEEDRARALDDDRLVGHRRHVGAARRARSHDHGDLRNALGRHARLVEEDPPEVIAIGKDLGLQRQKRAARIDQVDARQPVLERDLLRAHVLLDGDRVVGAALDRRIVGDDRATSRPDTRPMPVTMPAPGASSSYMPAAASGESSRNGEPGSSSRSIRSRTGSLPCVAVALESTLAPPPYARTARGGSRSSATEPLHATRDWP